MNLQIFFDMLYEFSILQNLPSWQEFTHFNAQIANYATMFEWVFDKQV